MEPDRASEKPSLLRRSQSGAQAGRRALLENSSSGLLGEASNMLDNPGKIHGAMAGGIERLVDLLRVLAQRRRGAGGLRRLLRQSQVLHHQSGGKARLVA